MADQAPLSERDLFDGLKATAEALDLHRVRYALIGGMAASFRAQPRFTKDVDFLLEIPQIQLAPLLEFLGRRGFSFDLRATVGEWTQHHMTTVSYRGLHVDWLKPVIPPYQHVLERATVETWLGHPIRVASTEGLILLKLLAARTQDWLDIENLVAASGGRLDVDWIRAELQTVMEPDDDRFDRLMRLANRASDG